MKHGLDLYEEAVRLQEKHAQHARELGYEEVARRAEGRARRAKARAESIRQRATSAGTGTLPGS